MGSEREGEGARGREGGGERERAREKRLEREKRGGARFANMRHITISLAELLLGPRPGEPVATLQYEERRT